jgi:RecJ-like exonuclease
MIKTKLVLSGIMALMASNVFSFQGLVSEVKQTSSYTYLKVQGQTKSIWMAVTKTKIDTGEIVDVDLGKPYKDFPSKVLKKTFKELHLVSQYKLNGKIVGSKSAPLKKKIVKANIKLGSIKKAEYLVSEIFKKKDHLAGKQIKVRAKVVKFASRIMGKNWIHLQDGSGLTGTNDLTVTSQDKVKVGDVVLVSGSVITNKDFGAGYSYKVLIENAKIIKE